MIESFIELTNPPNWLPAVLGKRIIGGTVVESNSIQYQASLLFMDHHFCGGTLIHPQWVVSAAHCWRPWVTAFSELISIYEFQSEDPQKKNALLSCNIKIFTRISDLYAPCPVLCPPSGAAWWRWSWESTASTPRRASSRRSQFLSSSDIIITNLGHSTMTSCWLRYGKKYMCININLIQAKGSARNDSTRSHWQQLKLLIISSKYKKYVEMILDSERDWCTCWGFTKESC